MKRVFTYIAGYITSWDLLPLRVRDFIMWPLASRILSLSYHEEVLLKDGFKMVGSMEDILTRDVLFEGRWKKNLWEPATSLLVEKLSKEANEIVVAGSHIGYIVLKAAQATSGRVHAFEPVPKLFRISKVNFSLNPHLESKISIANCALGETDGELDLYLEEIRSSAIPYSGGHVQNKNILKVRQVSLDSYFREIGVKKVDLILLDIEGFEWYALDGSKQILAYKPELILEVSPRILKHTHISPNMLFERLATLGYKLFFIDDANKGLSLAENSAENRERFLQRDYVNIYATTK